MARIVSFTITKKNNVTEKIGLEYLLSSNQRFFVPDTESRKQILDLLDLGHNFIRAFDMVMFDMPVSKKEIVEINKNSEFKMIEVKVTKKELPNNPDGFFFGATQNEFDLARRMGERFMFCFVSIHDNSRSYSLLTMKELESRIKHKRTQYQINL